MSVEGALASTADGIVKRVHPFLNTTKSRSIKVYSSLCVGKRKKKSRALSLSDLLQNKFVSHKLLSSASKKSGSSGVKRELLLRGHWCNFSDINLIKGCGNVAGRSKPFPSQFRHSLNTV